MAIQDFYVPITLKSYTESVNNKSEVVKSYTNSTINGYVGSRTDLEQITNGKWTVKTQYRCYTDTNIRYGDLIVYNNETYRVVSDAQNTVNLTHHFKSMVEKIENINY